MFYTYEDSFLTKRVKADELEELESNAIIEADKIGIDDSFYKEKYVVSKVYVEIAKRHIEADGMDKKLEVYKQEMEKYYQLFKSNSAKKPFASIVINRG